MITSNFSAYSDNRIPRLVHIRGWPPPTRQQVQRSANSPRRHCRMTWCRTSRRIYDKKCGGWSPSSRIIRRFSAGRRDDLMFLAYSMAVSVRAAHFKVNTKDISVAPETIPARRKAPKAWYTARHITQAANKNYPFAMPHRALQV